MSPLPAPRRWAHAALPVPATSVTAYKRWSGQGKRHDRERRAMALVIEEGIEATHVTPAPPSATQKPAGGSAEFWWSGRWALAVIIVVTGLLYTVLAVALNAHLFTYGFDLGVYYEALRGYAHFGLPLVALKGTHYNLLGDHFEPMVALLVPTYWIWPNPGVLLVDQGILVALSVIPVWMFAERRFGLSPGIPRLTTTSLVATYALAWQLQSLVGSDFHSLAFAVPILAVTIERADAGRWRAATIWALSLLLVKEDLSLIVVAFGVYAFVAGPPALGHLAGGGRCRRLRAAGRCHCPCFRRGSLPPLVLQRTRIGTGPRCATS